MKFDNARARNLAFTYFRKHFSRRSIQRKRLFDDYVLRLGDNGTYSHFISKLSYTAKAKQINKFLQEFPLPQGEGAEQPLLNAPYEDDGDYNDGCCTVLCSIQ